MDIREPDCVNLLNYDNAPVYDSQFTAAVCTAEINAALSDIIGLAGMPPMLSEKISLFPTTTATDWLLPADFGALRRVAYLQVGATVTPAIVVGGSFEVGDKINLTITQVGGGTPVVVTYTVEAGDITLVGVTANLALAIPFFFVTAVVGQTITLVPGLGVVATYTGQVTIQTVTPNVNLDPYRLEQLTQVEFDQVAGTGQSPQTQLPLGLPYWVREPIAYALRFYPNIGATQVANGDQIELTYESTGATLALGTDVPGIPTQFHRALSFRAAEVLWLVKQDEEQSDRYAKKFGVWVERARMLRWDVSRAGDFGIIDAEGPGSFNEDYATEW